jgi:superfamily I DNA and/or RNA helicase
MERLLKMKQKSAIKMLTVQYRMNSLIMKQKSAIQMLTVQYRMNSMIMKWSSSTFYEGKLSAASLVADHKLSDLSHVTRCELTNTVLMMIDTAGKRMEESKSASRVAPSFANLGEAAVVVQHVQSLVQQGVRPGEIAIVTPYSLQVNIFILNNYIILVKMFFLGGTSKHKLAGRLS